MHDTKKFCKKFPFKKMKLIKEINLLISKHLINLSVYEEQIINFLITLKFYWHYLTNKNYYFINMKVNL